MNVVESNVIVSGMDASALTAETVNRVASARVTCWHKNMGGVESFGEAHAFADRPESGLSLIKSAADVLQVKREGKLGIVLGLKTAAGLGNPFASTGTPLRAYYELGLRFCGLAFNVSNMFAGGCLEPTYGLTNAGRKLVEELHAARIILDVGGPTSERASLDAIGMSAGVPIVSSNTNVRALNDNPRCISNELIEAIAATNGLVGLTAISDYMVRNAANAARARSPRATLEAYLDQFDYVRKLVGVEHIALGPNFVGNRNEFTQSRRDMFVYPPGVMGEWPYDYVEGFEKIEELPNVVRGLQSRGWAEADLVKVLGGNWVRVYEAVWSA